MDPVNRFETKTTLGLLRAEFGVALVVSVAFFLWHIADVHWVPAIALFVYIDLIGYIPGAIAYHRAHGGEISRTYYVLYNLMHSLLTQAAVVGVWIAVAGFQWALLAVPIHLCGDRAIFGNFLKSFKVPFEPVVVPGFVEFDSRVLEQGKDKYPVPERTSRVGQ
jgi:hypothetical protein